MDRRIKKTRILIYEAFTKLLLEEKYSKITIQEIINYANIGRSTFYSHFETKDELLKSMCTDMFNEMCHNNDISLHIAPAPAITSILHHIEENRNIIKGVFLSESGELFMSYFKDYFNKQIEQHLFESYDEKTSGVPKDFLINHISGSFIAMIKWWVEGDMRKTPEELTNYFIYVISPVILKCLPSI